MRGSSSHQLQACYVQDQGPASLAMIQRMALSQ
uniref:Uncharacterized protein n=1 Tax=Arundo donax TaxID=35708 RepID=A0A0A8Y6A8_ARUDO